MARPSTQWREQIAPDEEARFARQAQKLKAVHAAKNARWGLGRLLHRKALLGAEGSFEVLPDLPDYSRYGLFTEARTYAVVARLSNGAFDVAANSKPDIRGFAIKVKGVSGPAALGGDASSQDFLLINHATFAAGTSDAFVDVVAASARGPLALIWDLIRKHGFGEALRRLKTLQTMLAKPFHGFYGETFDTVLPFTVGPYAARLRLTPTSASPARGDIADDMRARLSAGPLGYDVKLQFFVDEATTPIEDPTKPWPQSTSPDVTVGRLTLTGLADDVEALRFDPWGGLAEHRPLGEVMRARKSAYYLSQQGRGVA